ncbi:hypothetical protein Sjap_004001 [Stephania japonica]|uniref:RRM domain-containing protein n=1 Tax=Stephania japonica TaxID=461633 RepID=A0AAP0PGM1_9MAGN
MVHIGLRFARPKGPPSGGGGDGASPNLYVANCGPAVGFSFEEIASAFAQFGEVRGVHAADSSGARVIVSYALTSSARSAFEALNGIPCPNLGYRLLHIRYSERLQSPSDQVNDFVSVSLESSELQIPGLYLIRDFVTDDEEKELLAAVDSRPWNGLSKRRVQHYGYEFLYEIRNVDTKRHLGELPSFVSPILERISSFSSGAEAVHGIVDQLTVNEYPSGVGLAPHIDTHSAFEGSIFSLSLAGPCIMEFRRYSQGAQFPSFATDKQGKSSDNCLKKALFLPPRSMLVLSGEARLMLFKVKPSGEARGEFPSHFVRLEMDLAAANFPNIVIRRVRSVATGYHRGPQQITLVHVILCCIPFIRKREAF